MTELKTLKDLHAETSEYPDDLVWIKDLREEAIKWVKERRENLEWYNNRDWSLVFMEFFNLTEEDLK